MVGPVLTWDTQRGGRRAQAPGRPRYRSDTMTMPNTTETAEEPRGGGGARAQIREVKDQVVDQARNTYRQARDSATDSLSRSRNETADRMNGIASAFRRTSESLRSEQQDRLANLTDTVAEQVDRFSSYLRDH